MVCTLCLAGLLCPRRELRLKSSARWLTQIELHAEPVGDFPREGETEAAAAGAARARFVTAEPFVRRQPRKIIVRHTRSRVSYLQLEALTAIVGLERHVHGAAALVIDDRVVDDIRERLLYQGAISRHRRRG